MTTSNAKDDAPPAWQQINALFEKHNLPAPPTRLRDVLVEHLVAHRNAKARGEA